MKTIAIVSKKGGAGKSTLAIQLAVAAFLNKKESLLIDLDPQSSATSWGDSREAESPTVVSAQASRLQNLLSAAQENNVDITVIDTPPNLESTALVAIRTADLILIPCRPAIFDLHAVKDTVELVKIANKSAFVVLNAVPSRGNLGDDAQTAISGQSIEVCPWRITQRIAFVHAISSGLGVQEYEPSGKAAAEIKSLYRWVLKQLK